MKKLEKIFKALGDQNRLRILKMLELRPLCNCEVQEVLGLAPSTISKHLGLLRTAGLVEDKRQGKWVIYSLVTEEASPYNQPLLTLVEKWLDDEKQVNEDREIINKIQGKLPCDQGA